MISERFKRIKNILNECDSVTIRACVRCLQCPGIFLYAAFWLNTDIAERQLQLFASSMPPKKEPISAPWVTAAAERVDQFQEHYEDDGGWVCLHHGPAPDPRSGLVYGPNPWNDSSVQAWGLKYSQNKAADFQPQRHVAYVLGRPFVVWWQPTVRFIITEFIR